MDSFYRDGNLIRDEYGRERIFRGVNICIKAHKLNTGLKGKSLSEYDLFKTEYGDGFFNAVRGIGANIIRLGITWALIEPSEGEYNIGIINAYKSFIGKCEEHGIYVILDMHQDLFSHKFHGDGAPHWAIDSGIKGKRYLAVWAEGYFYMDSVQQAFCDFWTNKNNIQDKFIRMWKFFSNEFKDCKNVIGLDYFNEPYIHRNGRDVFLSLIQNICKIVYGKDIELDRYFKGNDRIGFLKSVIKIAGMVKTPKRLKYLLSAMDSYDNFKKAVRGLEKYTCEFNEKYYQSFYDKICKEAGLDGRFSLFEHNYYSNLGIPFEIEANADSIYSPHAYDIFIDSPLYDKYSSNERIHMIIDAIAENQKRMNVPVIFGEWGGGAPSGIKWIEHVKYISSLMEEKHWSSIYWAFNYKNSKLADALNIPYPVAVCGDIIEMKTDRDFKIFTLKWKQDKKFDNETVKTEVYVPERGIVKFNSNPGINEITVEY